jgi:hypothetical protein
MDMKHSVMTWRKETRLSPVPPPDEEPEGRGGSAFDLWLRRGLHQLFDDVANEPVPEELLRLIESDRTVANGTASDHPHEMVATPEEVPTEQPCGGAPTTLDRPSGTEK